MDLYRRMIFRIGVLLVLFNVIFINAQLDFRKTVIGMVAGPNYSQIQHAHNPSKPRVSFYMGVFARIPLGILCSCETPKFYLQPQLEYVQTGEAGLKTTLYANNYLSIPIFLKTYPIKYNDRNFFFVQFGPRFSYLVGQRVVDPPRGRPYAISKDGKANNFDVSATIASGISFGERNHELLLRYDYSFTDAYPNLNEYAATGDPNAQLRKVQHIVSLAYSVVLF